MSKAYKKQLHKIIKAKRDAPNGPKGFAFKYSFEKRSDAQAYAKKYGYKYRIVKGTGNKQGYSAGKPLYHLYTAMYPWKKK